MESSVIKSTEVVCSQGITMKLEFSTFFMQSGITKCIRPEEVS